MTNGAFPTFDLGNVLVNAENIQTSRDARTQANALAQRNAQNQILLQQFLRQQPGGGLAGNFNALNQLAVGAGVPAAQEAQEFVRQQQETQERETDENIRILDMISGAPNIIPKLQLLFPERAEDIEASIVDAGGPSFDQMTNDQAQLLVDNIRTQLLPGASPALLKELGEVGPLEVIATPTSPTGRQFATREEAVGRAAPAPGPLVTVTTGETIEAAGAKEFGKLQAQRVQGIIDSGREASRQNLQLDRMADLLEQINTLGPGAATLQQLKAFTQGFLGVDLSDLGLSEDVAPAEAIKTISAEMALRLRNPASGLGLTGNTSDKDLAFLRSIPPGLSKTRRGNQLILNFMQRVNQRRIEESNITQDFIRDFRFGVDDQGRSVEQVLQLFNDANSIFSDADQELIKRFGNPPDVPSDAEIFQGPGGSRIFWNGSNWIDVETGEIVRGR